MELKCKNGHIFERTIDELNNGFTYCPECEYSKRTNYLESLDYSVLSNDIDNFIVECKNGHIFKRSWATFIKGYSLCPLCYPKPNDFKNDIKLIIKNVDDIIFNNKSLIQNYNIDFYLPKFKLAINCYDDYKVSDKHIPKTYFLDLHKKCFNKDIKLVNIFNSYWDMNMDKFENILKNILGKNKTIDANECEIGLVTKAEEIKFLIKNNIGGYKNSTICYGLYYKHELIFIAGFIKIKTQTRDTSWSMSYYCSKLGLNVDNVEILLNYFEKDHNGILVSFSSPYYNDINFFKRLDFTFSHYCEPEYWSLPNTKDKVWGHVRCMWIKNILSKKKIGFHKKD